MLNNMAEKKLSTSKPLITVADNKISKAFITKVKSPKVKILIGKVIKTKNGFKDMLTKPKKIANHKADQTPFMFTPGTI